MQDELYSLALETALEEVGAELEDVAGLLLADLAFECADFVGEEAGQRHVLTL